ncbi:MAG TPA: ABC transporter permease [Gracilimonas sp.]|nr:ABC transporter permease [Gracilimonas sp.]
MFQKILYNFDIALEAIQRNKLRAFLTSLGIIFGVSSVIAMLAIGNGAQQEVLTQMQLLGTNNVIVQPVVEQREGTVNDDEEQQQSTKFSPGLTMEDLNSIKELVPEVEKLSPEIVYETSFIREARMRTGKLVGVNTDYFDISNFDVVEGSNFTDIQIDQADPVCVIGYDVKTRFFAGEDPIGKKIKVGHLWLTVVGVLEKKEVTTENIENLGIRNFNLDIYAPVTTVLLRFRNRAVVTSSDLQQGNGSTVIVGGGMVIMTGGSGNSSGSTANVNYNQLDRLIVKVTDTKFSGTIAEVLSRMLKRRHNNVVDFEIIVPEQLLQQEQQTKRIFNIVLSTIASISLIVGGIGIMNIMLASVVERFREIGVRMAVGAQKKDIELQFLTEALTISITGGFLGIVVGLAFSYIIEATADIATIVTPISIFISFGVAVLIGVVFGYYPAKRAAKHDPVHALRHE